VIALRVAAVRSRQHRGPGLLLALVHRTKST
jgi:hypothetical protein